MTFKPTFAMSIYRSALVGRTPLVIRAIQEQPLATHDVYVLEPLVRVLQSKQEQMNLGYEQVVDRPHLKGILAHHPSIDSSDVFTKPTMIPLWVNLLKAAQAKEREQVIIHQTDLALVLSDVSGEYMRGAAQFIASGADFGMCLSSKRGLAEHIHASLQTSFRAGNRAQPMHLDPDEVLWTLKRHHGWMKEAAAELMPEKKAQKVKILEAWVKERGANDPGFYGDLRRIRWSDPSYGYPPHDNVTYPNKVGHGNYRRQYVAGSAIISGLEMLKADGLLSDGHVHAYIERARAFGILDHFMTAYGSLHRGLIVFLSTPEARKEARK